MSPTTWTWRISAEQLRRLYHGAEYTHLQHGITLEARRDGDGVVITVTLVSDRTPPAATRGEPAGH